MARTADGIKINPLYTRTDALVYAEGEMPGSAPFTRGTMPVRDGLGWDIRTFHIENDPAAANAAILEDLEGGVTSIALHIGGIGIPSTREAIAAALDCVMLDVCPIALFAGEAAFDAAAAASTRCGTHAASPPVTAKAPTAPIRSACWPCRTPVRAGRDGDCPRHRLDETVGTKPARHGDDRRWRRLSHRGGKRGARARLHAGDARCLPARGQRRRDHPGDALGKINVALAADIDEFATIAKLRAARRLIWRVADACGAGDAARGVRIACPTSYRMMARRDPWTNILRTTIACAGAALGGADAIVVLPFTFALGKPDAFARRVARNIQIVLPGGIATSAASPIRRAARGTSKR